MQYPKLRHGIEIQTAKHQGRAMVLLCDRLGVSRDHLLLNPATARLVASMNGENSLRDLQVQHMRFTGQMLMTEELQKIISVLDEHLFLENDRFIKEVAERVGRFRSDPVRRMSHGGQSYPDDPDELRALLDGFFSEASGGPGTPRPNTDPRRLAGLCSPHIDLNAGGPCFAHAYKAMLEAESPHTWVILGTSHEPADNLFALTVKDFETPLGEVRCDRKLCERIAEAAPRDLFASEYHHAREHTIEFQAVFLAHLQPQARIVPLLCSFDYEEWREDRDYIDAMADLLKDAAQRADTPVGFIASVDLAHVGPRYGDSFHPNRATVNEHLQADRQLLDLLATGDAEGFMNVIARERNRRSVCGVAPLYVLTRILAGRARGVILNHTYSVVDRQNSFVTYASLAFYE